MPSTNLLPPPIADFLAAVTAPPPDATAAPMLATPAPACPRHYFRPAAHQPDPVLASELVGSLTEFQSASEVNQFLSRLLVLLAQDRLSPRRGAVMAYTCNLILRSLHAIDIENKIADEAPREIICDLVRPKREDDPPPPPSHPIMPTTAAEWNTERPQT